LGEKSSDVELEGQFSPLFEIASVLVRFEHIASFIVNANHRIIALEIESAQN